MSDHDISSNGLEQDSPLDILPRLFPEDLIGDLPEESNNVSISVIKENQEKKEELILSKEDLDSKDPFNQLKFYDRIRKTWRPLSLLPQNINGELLIRDLNGKSSNIEYSMKSCKYNNLNENYILCRQPGSYNIKFRQSNKNVAEKSKEYTFDIIRDHNDMTEATPYSELQEKSRKKQKK